MTEEETELCRTTAIEMDDLCSRMNDQREMAAAKKYLESDQHTHFLTCEALVRNCKAELKRIKAGGLSAHVQFACCEDCFKSIMSERPGIEYPCYSPDHEEESATWLEVDSPSTAPDDPGELELFLDQNGCGLNGISYHWNQDDIRRRGAYLKALRSLTTAAARLSKRFDAKEAALDLLSALRFFEPKPKDELLSSYGYPPILTLAEAAEAYAALTRGFSRLWAQIEYAKLKAL